MPSLSMPIFAEKRISAALVDRIGCGKSIQAGEFPSGYPEALQYLLESETCRENLVRYREKYAYTDKSDKINDVVAACEKVLATRK